MKLSAIIIAKNAEGEIADAISSLDFADEVIVVDNGSSDRTVEIAQYLKAKVFTSSSSDFSQLRNLGLQKALGEWVLYIDTDERVTSELASSIKHQVVRTKNNEFAAFKIKRKNFYLGNHEWPFIEKIERLFRKDSLKGWRGELHESPIVEGPPVGGVELEGFLLHYTHNDPRSMLVKTIEWSKIEAELRFKAGHPRMTWWRFLRVILTAFFNSYIRQEGWRVGTVGIIESLYQAFSIFITYARLWEMQQEKVKSQNAKVKTTT